MKITNKQNIPIPIYRSIQAGWYDGNNATHYCSATQLLKPAKIFVLEKRHKDEIEEDASDLIWSLMGSAMHKVLEKSETGNTLNEERLFAEVDGKIISGGIDLYEDEVISDFKFTSVWSYIYGSRIREWEEQLNIYAYLYRKAGFNVKKLQIVAIFRDWSKIKSEIEHNYPKQVESVNIKLWSLERAEQFITARLRLFQYAEQIADDVIPACSNEQRWQEPDKYAVKKMGNKRASKLCDSQKQAQLMIDHQKDSSKYVIELRKSVPKRCISYCKVNKFCNFYKRIMQAELAS